MLQAASSPVGTQPTLYEVAAQCSQKTLILLIQNFFVFVLSSMFCDVDIALEFGFPSLVEAA